MCSRSPRPVFTKQQEQTDEEEGLVEKSIERQPMYFRYIAHVGRNPELNNPVAGSQFLKGGRRC